MNTFTYDKQKKKELDIYHFFFFWIKYMFYFVFRSRLLQNVEKSIRRLTDFRYRKRQDVIAIAVMSTDRMFQLMTVDKQNNIIIMTRAVLKRPGQSIYF